MKFLTSLFPLDNATPAPNVTVPAPKAPPGLEQPFYDVLGYVRWGAIIFLVGLLFVQAARLASAKRGMESEPIKGFIYWIAGAIIIGAAAQIMRMFLG